LVTKLNSHSSVKGLFWWWPEDNGNKNVTANWWNAALYNHNTGKPYAAFYELKNFNDESAGINELTTIDKNDTNWYSLAGYKLEKKPSRKGIYVNSGQRLIVK